MLQLALVLFGVTAATIGWGWGGAGVGRAAWVATGVPALLLAGITIFSAPGGDESFFPIWAFAAVSAVLGGLAAAMAAWGVATDLAFGLVAFFYAGAAGLSTAGYSNAINDFDILSLGLLLSAVVGGLAFLAAAVVPAAREMRRVVGWMLVFLGLGIAFLGYAPSIEVTF